MSSRKIDHRGYYYERWDGEGGDIEYRILFRGHEVARVRDIGVGADEPVDVEAEVLRLPSPRVLAHRIVSSLNSGRDDGEAA